MINILKQNNEKIGGENNEDIEEVYFKGYVDENEEEYQEKYAMQINNIKYPKLRIMTEEK